MEGFSRVNSQRGVIMDVLCSCALLLHSAVNKRQERKLFSIGLPQHRQQQAEFPINFFNRRFYICAGILQIFECARNKEFKWLTAGATGHTVQ